MNFKTEQENFWAGDFGEEYISRNSGSKIISSNLNFLSNALENTRDFSGCIEFGANAGMNLIALKLLFPGLKMDAIEINPEAVKTLRENFPNATIYEGSIIDFKPLKKWDLVLIKGVLIHINPKYLEKVYENLFNSTSRYILLCEYYSRAPEKLDYRGYKNKLFKRDFCGELLDRYKNLRLVDYGFVYHRDQRFPQDDLSWFLLEKVDG